VVEVRACKFGGDDAVAQHEHSGAQSGKLLRLCREEKYPDAIARCLPQTLEYFFASGGVNTRCRIVKHKDGGAYMQPLAKQRLLLIPTA
jgi:hypothetical protein